MKKYPVSKEIMLKEALRLMKEMRNVSKATPLGKEYVNRAAYMYESVASVLRQHRGNLNKIESEIVEEARLANQKADKLAQKLKKKGYNSRELFDHPGYTMAWREQARRGAVPVYFRELKEYLDNCTRLASRKTE